MHERPRALAPFLLPLETAIYLPILIISIISIIIIVLLVNRSYYIFCIFLFTCFLNIGIYKYAEKVDILLICDYMAARPLSIINNGAVVLIRLTVMDVPGSPAPLP